MEVSISLKEPLLAAHRNQFFNSWLNPRAGKRSERARVLWKVWYDRTSQSSRTLVSPAGSKTDRELGRSCCSAIESLLAYYTMRQIKIESAHFLMFVCRCWMKLAPGCLSAPFNISCFISCMLASVTYENNTKLCRKAHMKIMTNCKNNPTFPSLCDWC